MSAHGVHGNVWGSVKYSDVVSFMQHGSMLVGLGTKEDVVICLLVLGYVTVGSDDSADG